MKNDYPRSKTNLCDEETPLAPELSAWHDVFNTMCECGKHNISELELMEILNDRFILKSK